MNFYEETQLLKSRRLLERTPYPVFEKVAELRAAKGRVVRPMTLSDVHPDSQLSADTVAMIERGEVALEHKFKPARPDKSRPASKADLLARFRRKECA